MQNPCHDKRHMAIWHPDKHKFCSIDSTILIVGPQKTGTTALHTFLLLNPLFKTSPVSEQDFEEVQFFNDKHYWRGSDWYFGRLLSSNSSSSSLLATTNLIDDVRRVKQANDKINLIDRIRQAATKPTTGSDSRGSNSADHRSGASGHNTNKNCNYYYVDKSATYFDDPKAVRRASSLLPDAYIIILLIDPADRAYSWYQHIKAHGDPVANEFTFDEIIMHSNPALDAATGDHYNQQDNGNSTSSRSTSQAGAIRALRQRCLHPGYYSSHLSQWLAYYPSRRIIIIDGEWFKYNPVAVLNRLQLLLRVPKPLDYSHLLAYNERKGFYCERIATPPIEFDVRASSHHTNGKQVEGKHRRRRNQGRQQHQQQHERLKCLGSGKGRQYEPMSREARNYLNNHYWEHNRQLAKLLYEIGQPLPSWLDESINQLMLVTTQRERRRTD